MKQKVWLIPLLLCLLLAGCGKTNTPVSVEPMPAEPPPYMLWFQNLEELETFFSAAEMAEEMFEDYVDRNDYNMNGIRSKADLADLMEQLAEVPFPEISGGTLSSVRIEPERGWLYVNYTLENEDSLVFELKFTERQSSRKQKNFEPAFQKSTSHWFKGMVDGYTISCGYYGSEKNALKAMEERELTFRPVAELYFRKETAVEPMPAEPPAQALVFYSVGDLQTFFAEPETAELQARLASAPFPEVTGGVLDYVSIDEDGKQAYVRYTVAPDEYGVFRIDCTEQADPDAQEEFALTGFNDAQGVYCFETDVKGYHVVFWYHGGIQMARDVIGQQTTYRSWANTWTMQPVKERVFSNLAEFEAEMKLQVWFVPQGIPAGYTLGRIIVDSAYVTYHYFPEDARDLESQRPAQSQGDYFEFSFDYAAPDKIVDTEIIWNEDHHVYIWRLGGHSLNLNIPISHSPAQYEAETICAVETRYG